MKKLLILFMVLAIASNASAAMVEFVILGSSNPAGDYQGMPSYPDSTILTIGIVETTQIGIMNMNGVVIYGPPTAQDPLFSPQGAVTNGPSTWWTGGPALNSNGFIKNAGGVLIDGINLACFVNFLDYVIPGTTLYTFDYHVGGDPSEIIEIYGTIDLGSDKDFGNVGFEESILIHVPEPVTIALLGLGGLFLRRRK